VRTRLGHGGRTPLTILDTIGQGCGFLDYDHDGLLDIWLLSERGSTLYRNTGACKFEDVTQAAGANVPGYWHGMATGDFDGDGRTDVCLTGYRSLALLHNDGGRFRNVTPNSGLRTPGWGSSSAFTDLDGDGKLDLVVGEYLEFGPSSVQLCTEGNVKTACGPKIYSARFPVVYKNLGNRKFKDVTTDWGFDTANGKALGVAVGDFNGDGRIDLAIANDEMPGDLFIRSDRPGVHFRNEGIEQGFAFLANGKVQSGMGIDVADYDSDGLEDAIITNFQKESDGLYHNEGSLFEEASMRGGISEATYPYVGWGVRFFDPDNDGDLDLIIANGHIQDNVHMTRAATSYREPLLLFSHGKDGRFHNVYSSAGPAFTRSIVGRGLAVGDIDNDGRPDVLVVDIEGAPLLLHNQSPSKHRWLGLEVLTGTPPRHALGALATIVRDSKRISRRVSTTGSIFSAQDPRVHFGLGDASRVDKIEITWPDGQKEEFAAPPVDRYSRIIRGKGRPVR
jgi:enediyne biosynthesis protein E4